MYSLLQRSIRSWASAIDRNREAFRHSARSRLLNASWFLSMADTRDRIERWRREYNEDRPHTALARIIHQAGIRMGGILRDQRVSWTV